MQKFNTGKDGLRRFKKTAIKDNRKRRIYRRLMLMNPPKTVFYSEISGGNDDKLVKSLKTVMPDLIPAKNGK
jgi:hypothetical protein